MNTFQNTPFLFTHAKISETTVLEQRVKLKIKHGHLSSEQIVGLKRFGVPIIIPATLPSENTWRFISSSFYEYGVPTYKIVYYDQETHKSFAMVSGDQYFCGPHSRAASSWLHSGTQTYISNPILGNIGLVTVEYQNAYVTKAIIKAGRCYALVTPANYFDNLHDFNVPTDLSRLSKKDFESVIRSLRYLP